MFKALNENGKAITPLIFKSFIDSKKINIPVSYVFDLDGSCEHSMFFRDYEEQIKDKSNKQKIQNIKNRMSQDNIYESIMELNTINK
jgi:hypothetical protein